VGGPPKLGRPGAPDLKADREAKRDFSEEWEVLKQQLDEPGESSLGSSGESVDRFQQGVNDVDFGTSDTYTSYRGNYWTTQQLQFPWKVVGKLLIDGGGYCTAQSITGAPKNILVTAAHCVYDRANRRFYSGWTFVPAERNGVAPYGQFRWASARVLNAYIKKGNRRSDVALIRLQNNAAGRPVSFYTGWLGWRQNFPYVASLHSIGYASNVSTQWTSMCTAESFFATCEGTDVLVKGCNMTFGSSGGAWIEQYKPYEVSGYVEAVVSGPSCAGTFGQTYVGPRFASGNFATLCAAEGGCTTP
jgi:V8-like Glu-specific endopeptidase